MTRVYRLRFLAGKTEGALRVSLACLSLLPLIRGFKKRGCVKRFDSGRAEGADARTSAWAAPHNDHNLNGNRHNVNLYSIL